MEKNLLTLYVTRFGCNQSAKLHYEGHRIRSHPTKPLLEFKFIVLIGSEDTYRLIQMYVIGIIKKY